MFNLFTKWNYQRVIRSYNIDNKAWNNCISQLPFLSTLSEQEQISLNHLVKLFLHYKAIEGAHNLKITEEMRLIIAAQACLPILNLGFEWYSGWVSVIVYPSQFIPERKHIDQYGIEHRTKSVLSGESWHKGPLIISWEDSKTAGIVDGYNVVIHEFAHKLDVLNGDANGFPPLHKEMDKKTWTEVLSYAFNHFCSKIQSGEYTPFNTYGASSPAEFFAVLSEVFFEQPGILDQEYPDVYTQFVKFYKQDTLTRFQN